MPLQRRDVHTLMLLLAWGLVSLCGYGQHCQEAPIGFKTDIRMPDEWEESWEQEWPEASAALNIWRAENFELLQLLWKNSSPVLQAAQTEAQSRGLPTSSAFLAVWSSLADPTSPHAVNQVPHDAWSALEAVTTGVEAMKWTFARSGSTLSLDEWSLLVRTGMRLIENLALPDVHVVQPGETVYSISRMHACPPKCLASKNQVWDDLKPGMCLLIPEILP